VAVFKGHDRRRLGREQVRETSIRTDGLNGLTVVTKPSPRESNPGHRTRSVSPRPRGRSLRRGFGDTRATVLARVVSRTCLEQHSPLPLYRRTGLRVVPPAVGCPGLGLRRRGLGRVWKTRGVGGPWFAREDFTLFGHLRPARRWRVPRTIRPAAVPEPPAGDLSFSVCS